MQRPRRRSRPLSSQRPVATIGPLVLAALALGLVGCVPEGLLGSQGRLAGGGSSVSGSAASGGAASSARSLPALSGDGRLLASQQEGGGRPILLLERQPTGQPLPLRHWRGRSLHGTPSLSWNGRYLAGLAQVGGQRLLLIEDRSRGSLLRMPLPGRSLPEAVSLAPDGQRLALALVQDGRSRVQVFDLGAVLEPDLPAGWPAQGGGPFRKP